MNKFHFTEIDWFIYFPATGNQGRDIRKYGVAYRERIQSTTQQGPRINLEDVLVLPIIQNGYPHTVGFFQVSTGKGNNWLPNYIETRLIQNEEELLMWFLEIEGN
jgi:hypothetical protein